MSVCDPYREIELYLEQAHSDISEVFDNWDRTKGTKTAKPNNAVQKVNGKEAPVPPPRSPKPSVQVVPNGLAPPSVPTQTNGTLTSNGSSNGAIPRRFIGKPVVHDACYDDFDNRGYGAGLVANSHKWRGARPRISGDNYAADDSVFVDDVDGVLFKGHEKEHWGHDEFDHFNYLFEDQQVPNGVGVRPSPNVHLQVITSPGQGQPHTSSSPATISCSLSLSPSPSSSFTSTSEEQSSEGAAATGSSISHNGTSSTSCFSGDGVLMLPVRSASSSYYCWEPQHHPQQDLAKASSVPYLLECDDHNGEVNRQQQVRSQSDHQVSDIEASEACKWLRAAGFPQYAQMYETQQFPVEITAVEQDHPQLEAAVLSSLFRRLHILNRCARMNQQVSSTASNQNQNDDSEDEQCALSDNWTYQSDIRRWSRTCQNLEIPSIESKEWHQLSNAMAAAVSAGDNTTLAVPEQRQSMAATVREKLRRGGSTRFRRRNNRDGLVLGGDGDGDGDSIGSNMLDMLSRQLINLSAPSGGNTGSKSVGRSRDESVSPPASDSECNNTFTMGANTGGGSVRQSRRSKTRSLDKCDTWAQSPNHSERTCTFGVEVVLTGLEASNVIFSRTGGGTGAGNINSGSNLGPLATLPQQVALVPWQPLLPKATELLEPEERRLELEEGGRSISTLSCAQLQVLRKLALLKLTAHMEKYCPSHRTGWNWDLPKLIIRKMKSPLYKEKMVFGVPLTVILQRTGYPIPKGIESALLWLNAHARDSVGIFRKSGVKSRIQQLKILVEQQGEATDFSVHQAYDIADMVKQYFRELPEALLTNKLSETFILIFQHVPPYLRREATLCAILLMPDEHTEALRALLVFLADIAGNSETNQMTASNLALCFAPSLFHYSQVPGSRQGLGAPHPRELAENRAAHECLQYFLNNYENVFCIPRELLSQCKSGEIKDSNVLSLEKLGADLNGDWHSYLQECQNALLREVREKNRGWLMIPTHYARVELAFKKVADGQPLRLWKSTAEVEAPPTEVLRRVLWERHIWDEELHSTRTVAQLDAQTEVRQFSRRNVRPLPLVDYCVVRTWRTDIPPKGACLVVETSVEHEDAPPLPDSVRGIVLGSRYLIEPCGSGKSRIVFLSRVDTRGRMPEWYHKNYGHICTNYIAALQHSFRKTATGPESKV